MGRYCGDCDYRLCNNKECCGERNKDGCVCDLTNWHEENPIKDGKYITRESSMSNGGDIFINERWFRNNKWIGLVQEVYNDWESVLEWIEEEKYQPFVDKESEE